MSGYEVVAEFVAARCRALLVALLVASLCTSAVACKRKKHPSDAAMQGDAMSDAQIDDAGLSDANVDDAAWLDANTLDATTDADVSDASDDASAFDAGMCDDGYAPMLGVCEDIDECSTNNGGCDPTSQCTNLPGTFECGGCTTGYVGDGLSGCVPRLTGISLHEAALSPTFDAETVTYSAQVGVNDDVVHVSMSCDVVGATFSVNGAATLLGDAAPVSLNIGDNTIEVEVEAANGENHSYTLQVSRAPTVLRHAYIKASNTNSQDGFGRSVALDGDTLVVGAPGEDSNATGIGGDQTSNAATESGAVYVFVRAGATWTQQAYLKSSLSNFGDVFGTSVALEGDTLVVGAPGEDSDGKNDSGAVFVFERDGDVWTQRAVIKPSETSDFDQFGVSVALDGDTLVVGAHTEDSVATGVDGNAASNSSIDSGAAYVFTGSGATWTQQAYLKASNTGAGDHFGTSVAVAGDWLAVGAPREGSDNAGVDPQLNNNAAESGAVYLFTRSGGTWTQSAWLKADNLDAADRFGTSLAMDGALLAIGAPGEGSLDGEPDNDAGAGAGAVYVFARSGSSWGMRDYVKPNVAGAADAFGTSLALAGDWLMVGAPREDGSGVAVNPAEPSGPLNNTVTDSGASYLFSYSSNAWAQTAYLKPFAANNAITRFRFGASVAFSQGTHAVGADGDSSGVSGINPPTASPFGFDNAGGTYIFR